MGGPVAVGAQAEKGLGCGGMCGQEKRSTLTLTNRRLEMMTLWTPLWRWKLLALLKWLHHSKEFQRYLSMNSVIRRMRMLKNENTKNKYKITKYKKAQNRKSQKQKQNKKNYKNMLSSKGWWGPEAHRGHWGPHPLK